MSGRVKILIIIVLLFVRGVYSQDLAKKKLLCSDCEKELSIKIEGTSFLKNNEYFNNFTKGFTGIGFFFKPTVEYYLTSSTKMNVGAYLLKYSGVKKFTEAIPIFSVHQKLSENLDLIFGSLYGTLNHRIEEPLFKFDRYYQNNVEYGLQFWYHSSFVESDLWVNWEKFIFKDSPFQEEFTVGNTSMFNLQKNNKFETQIPFQILITHKGGQIDASSNETFSIANGLFGLKFSYKTNQNKLTFEPLFFWYKGLGLPDSGVNSQKAKLGNAWYFKLKYKRKHFNSLIGYWQSNNFIAPKGEHLFLSTSDFDDAFFQPKRKLVTAKLETNYNISKSVQINFRVDGYYDLINSNTSYSTGLYLLINDSFFVFKNSKR